MPEARYDAHDAQGAIATQRPGLVLLPQRREDVADVLALMRANLAHLTQHSDYGGIAAQTPETYSVILANPDGSQQYAFRIVEDGVLIGSIALVPVEPPTYGLGYWLAADACRRGNATLSVQAIAEYARTQLRATDLFAGVRHGNAASVAVLQRAGFQQVAAFETYNRFHRALTE